MAHFTGKNLYIEFKGVEIYTDFRSITTEMSTDKSESSAGADNEKQYLTTLGDATISMDYVLENSAAGTAIDGVLYHKSLGTLTWGNEGTATGQPKYSCVAFVESVSDPVTYNEVVVSSVSFQKTGDWIANFRLNGDTW